MVSFMVMALLYGLRIKQVVYALWENWRFDPQSVLGLTFGAYTVPAGAQDGLLWLREPGALDRCPLWALFVMTVLVIFLSIEIGFRSAHALGRRSESEQKWPLDEIEAATLSLLAFMLAFTFGLAASRFETRKSLVMDEANALGTTYLRAGILPEPDRTEIRNLLREYLDIRLHAVQSAKVGEGIAGSEALQNRLWSEAAVVGEKNPGSVVIGLFIASLNEVIDLHTKRLTQDRNRIPSSIWAALYVVSVLGMAEVGYHGGLNTTRRALSVIPLTISVSAVMLLIADLDRSQEGLLRVSPQPLIDLQNSWNGSGS
jgi:hypothetical protein